MSPGQVANYTHRSIALSAFDSTAACIWTHCRGILVHWSSATRTWLPKPDFEKHSAADTIEHQVDCSAYPLSYEQISTYPSGGRVTRYPALCTTRACFVAESPPLQDDCDEFGEIRIYTLVAMVMGAAGSHEHKYDAFNTCCRTLESYKASDTVSHPHMRMHHRKPHVRVLHI